MIAQLIFLSTGLVFSLFSIPTPAWPDNLYIHEKVLFQDIDKKASYDPFAPEGNTVFISKEGIIEGALRTRHAFNVENQGLIQGLETGMWAIDLSAGGDIVNKGKIKFSTYGLRSLKRALHVVNEGEIVGLKDPGYAFYTAQSAPFWLVNKRGGVIESQSVSLKLEGPQAYLYNQGLMKSQKALLEYTPLLKKNATEEATAKNVALFSNQGTMMAQGDVFFLQLPKGLSVVSVSNEGVIESREGSALRKVGKGGILKIDNRGTLKSGEGPALSLKDGLSYLVNKGLIETQSSEGEAIHLEGGTHHIELDSGSHIRGKILAKNTVGSTLTLRGYGTLESPVTGFDHLMISGQKWHVKNRNPQHFSALHIQEGEVKFEGDIFANSIFISPQGHLIGGKDAIVKADHIDNFGTISPQGMHTIFLEGNVYYGDQSSYEISTTGHTSGTVHIKGVHTASLPPVLRVKSEGMQSTLAAGPAMPIIVDDTTDHSSRFSQEDLDRIHLNFPHLFLKPELSLSEDKKTVYMQLVQRGDDIFVSPELNKNEKNFGRALSRVYRNTYGDNGVRNDKAEELLNKILNSTPNHLNVIQDTSGVIYANLPYTMSKVSERIMSFLMVHLSNSGIMLMKKGIPFSVWSSGHIAEESRNNAQDLQDSATDTMANVYVGSEAFLKEFGTLGILLGVQKDELTVDRNQQSSVRQRARMSSYILAAYGRNGSRNEYGLIDGRFTDFSLGAAWHRGDTSGDNLRGHLSGYQIFGSVTAGHSFLFGEQWSVYPFFGARASYIFLDKEQLPNVDLAGKKQVGLHSILGLSLQEALCLCGLSDDIHYPFLNINVGWQHAWRLPNNVLRGVIHGTSEEYFLTPVSVPRDTFFAQSAVRFLFRRDTSASLIAGAHVWPSKYLDMILGVEIEYHW